MTTETATRMQRWREPAVWLLAFAAAAATGFGARSYLTERGREADRAAEARFRPTPVIVARTDLAPGSQLGPELLAIRGMPADYLPASVVPASRAQDLLGRITGHALRAGEPVQMPLLRPRAPVRLAERIPLGRRAVTIPVDESAAVAGLLQPGDRVDIRWRGGSGTELGNVAVLATGRQFGGESPNAGETDFATITLELAEADARRLAEADSSDVRILLRNPADTGVLPLPGSAAVARERVHGIALIVGGNGGPSPSVHLLPGAWQ